MPAIAKPERGTAKRTRATRYRAGLQFFRDEVWRRDESRSRASGRVLVRGSEDPQRGGQAAHLKARSSHPDERYQPSNGVLLSIEEHRWSDPRTAGAGGKALLRIEPQEPGGELRGDRRLTFIRVDKDGHELWRRTS